MSEYTTDDAVKFAVKSDAAQFKAAVNDILSQKVSDALEVKRVEVAHSFMAPKVEAEPEHVPDLEPDEVTSDEEI